MYRHKWTDEEKEYIEQISKGRHYEEIRMLMIKKFDYDYSLGQIQGAMKRYNLKTGFDTKFKAKHIPWNKGVKGVTVSNTKKPIGTEVLNANGYIKIKVAEPNVWKLKHRIIWEQYNGKIPDDSVIIFVDGDRTNVDIDNLMLISKKQNLIMNENELRKADAELTKTGVNIAKVIEKVSDLKKENKK